MFNNWPYTNLNELNLDWILQQVKDIQDKYTDLDSAIAAGVEAVQQQEETSLQDLDNMKLTIVTAINGARDIAIVDVNATKTNAINDITTAQGTAESAIAADKTAAQTAIETDKTNALAAIAALGNTWDDHYESLIAEMPADLASLTQTLAILGRILTGESEQTVTFFMGDYAGGSKTTPTPASTSDVSTNMTIGGAGFKFVFTLDDNVDADTKIYAIRWFEGKNASTGVYTGEHIVSCGNVRTYTWTVPDTCYGFSITLRNSETSFTEAPASDIATLRWNTTYSDFVSVDTDQDYTDEQKAQGRENIGAASADDIRFMFNDTLTEYFQSNVDRKIWYNGSFINYATRLSTTDPICLPYDVMINCPWYAVNILRWNSSVASDETLISNTLYTNDVVIEANTYFTVTFSKTNSAEFDLETDPAKIKAKSQYSILENKVDAMSENTGLLYSIILGDFYNGNIINSTKRMINEKPEIIETPKAITTDFTNYRIYIYEKASDSWSGLGWKTADYPLIVGYSYMFVIAINGTEPASLTSEQQTDIKAKTQYKPLVEYLKTSYGNDISNNTSQIVANSVMYDILPTFIPAFSGNTATSDPLIVRLGTSFYTRALTGGQGFTYHSCNQSYSISNAQCLAYNRDTQALEVVSASSLIATNYVVLLWKQGIAIKGLWTSYYAKSLASSLARKYHRLMNRQGEGYGYPDNSMPGVLMAINDGYKMIRIAVAHTIDNVFYVTHSYELQHNSTGGYLKIDGVAYTQDVVINNSTSEFIDSLTYKDYPIPKLSDMLAALALYDVQITIELKDSNDSTTAQILLKQLDYNNLNYIISGTSNQLSPFVALRDNLDIAVIFEYSDNDAEGYITQYEGHCKSLRFDCYWSDTISENSVKNVIHPKYKIKLGGGTGVPADTEIAPYLAWVDVAEVNYVYSRLP